MNTEPPHQLKVCSYNIHKGFSAMNTRYLLREIKQAIQLVDADIVFLQEVVGENLKNPKGSEDDNHFEYLADTTWPHFSYGKNATYQRGHHGNAILSKHSIRSTKNIDITHWSFSQRGILFAELNCGIYLLCVHFGLFQPERNRQLSTLLETIKNEIPVDAPLLVAGDFNDWNRKLDRVIVAESRLREVHSVNHGRVAKTFPAIAPMFTMDRIYYQNLDLVEVGDLSGNQWEKLSDHCALNAVFQC